MIKAVLFDMDGVLVDAKPWHYESLNMALEQCGFSPISLDEHLSVYDGLPTKKKIEKLALKDPKIMALYKDIESLKQQFTIEVARKNLKPQKYLTETVLKLKQEGYKMAVCSNSIANTVNLFMELAGIKQYFDFLLSNQDVKNPKPHPEIYTTAIARLNLSPKQCLILEDNIHGLEAAHGSGANVMQINDVLEVNYENIVKTISKINKE